MVTTIQVSEKMLMMLKKLKEQMQASSYEEAMERIVVERTKPKSLAGFLGKKTTKEILKGLKDKNDRF